MKPILLLDVDGVLNPVPFDHADVDWPFEPSFMAGSFRMNFSKEMLDAIQRLPVQIQWLTTWCMDPCNNDVQNQLEPALKLPPYPYHHAPVFPTRGWWKLLVVQKLLTEHPWSQRFVWIDDDIKDGTADLFDDRVLTISPASHIGVTRQHIELIKDFCRKERA